MKGTPIPIALIQKKAKKLGPGDVISKGNVQAEVVKVYPYFVRLKNLKTGLFFCVFLEEAICWKIVLKKMPSRKDDEDSIAELVARIKRDGKS